MSTRCENLQRKQANSEGQLLILERSLDMAAALVHEYSYEAWLSCSITELCGA